MSTGLIFLTNDGEIVNKILRAGNYHEKEYLVTVDKPVDEAFLHDMRSGVPILGVVTRECVVKKEGDTRFRIILTQGLNRQIRRMCEYLGYEVTCLERVRIMNISLGDAEIGQMEEHDAERAFGTEQADPGFEEDHAGPLRRGRRGRIAGRRGKGMEKGILYLVGTPIGNLSDISPPGTGDPVCSGHDCSGKIREDLRFYSTNTRSKSRWEAIINSTKNRRDSLSSI